MKRSEYTADLCKALALAQAEMKNPVFDSTNPHFKNKFASLAAIRNSVIPVLAKHGFSVLQELTTTQTGVAITTILNHSTGQYLEFGPLEVPVDKNTAQAFGSASTYGKRYSLQAALGIVGEEDDDGNLASASEPKKLINEKQKEEVMNALIDTESDIARFCKAFSIKEIGDLPAAQFEKAIQAINKKRSK